MRGLEEDRNRRQMIDESRRRENMDRFSGMVQNSAGGFTHGLDTLSGTFMARNKMEADARQAAKERAEKARQFDEAQLQNKEFFSNLSAAEAARLAQQQQFFEGIPAEVVARLNAQKDLHATPSGDTNANIASREAMQGKELEQQASQFAQRIAEQAKDRGLTQQQIDNQMSQWAANYGLNEKQFKHQADLELQKFGLLEDQTRQSMDQSAYTFGRQVQEDKDYDAILQANGISEGWIKAKAQELGLDEGKARLNLARAQEKAMSQGTTIDSERWMQEQALTEENQGMKREQHQLNMDQGRVLLDKVKRMTEAAQAAGFPSQEALEVQSMLTGLLGQEANIGLTDARTGLAKAETDFTGKRLAGAGTPKVQSSALEKGPTERIRYFKEVFPEPSLKDKKLKDVIMEHPEVLRDMDGLEELIRGARKTDKETVRNYSKALLAYEEVINGLISAGKTGVELEQRASKALSAIGKDYGFLAEE